MGEFLTNTLTNGTLADADSSILMHSEDTFTAESKSSTDQFTFIVKDRLV
jgi:hypothetical protein